jgi:hypothetical protein
MLMVVGIVVIAAAAYVLHARIDDRNKGIH